MENQVNKLLLIVRLSPVFIILLMSFLIILFLINEQKIEVQEQKNNIEKQFMQDEKERMKSNITSIYTYIKLLQSSEEDDLRMELKNKINNMHKLMTNIYIKNKDNKSKNEIIQHIKDAVETIRYNNGKEYFSIHTLEGINILQPITKSYEGTSVLNRKDIKGTFTVRKAISIAKIKGEGFLNWYSLKPNGGLKEFEKVGIVKKFEPYGLLITTGVFKEDFENSLKNKILDYISRLKYKNDAYPFVINFEGDVLYHPSENAINSNIFNERRFFHISSIYKNFILKKGIDSEDYLSIKPKVVEGENTKETKITYVKKFDDWKWIIATNFKLSDVNNIIEDMKIVEENKYESYKKEILFYGLIFTLVFLLLSYFIAKLLEEKFLLYKNKIEEENDRLILSQETAEVGDWKYNLVTKKFEFSDQVRKIFGINKVKENELIDYFKKTIHKDDLDGIKQAFIDSMQSGKDYYQIYRIYRPNNKIRWVSTKATLDKNKGCIKGVSQDITELKELEIDKIQKDELLYQQSKMAAMGEMLGNIAHQWRQPLSTISTASTGAKLQKEMDVLSDEELYRHLTTINDSAQYLSQIIEDFRGFFDPTNNKIEEFNISDTLGKTLKLVSAQFIAKDIEIIRDIESCKLISIENEMIQVLVNILNNARDALLTKEEQRRLLFINIYKKDEKIYIEILDNAGGIKEDIITRIFEPYFTTKHKSQGTGIGLYMSQEIINNHLDGNLSVSNEKYIYEDVDYKGAKFTIEIPLD